MLWFQARAEPFARRAAVAPLIAVACCSWSGCGNGNGTASGSGGAVSSTTTGGSTTTASASGSTTGSASASTGTGMSGFALSSPDLADGGMFAAKNTCKGANVSPALDWTGAPSGTAAYAIVMTDKSISLRHWVIWDIPPMLASLPSAVDKAYAPANVTGAKQTPSYDGQTRGYLGPCPPSLHTYEIDLYAVDTATLPGLDASSTTAAAETAILAHELGKASLSGTAMP